MRALAVATATFAAVTVATRLPSANGDIVGVTAAAEVSRPARPDRVVACPGWTAPETSGATEAPLDELSGLAPADATSWWTHNDSGDVPRVFRVDAALRVLAEVRLDVPFVFDVEDIAMDADGRLWVADIGDNLRLRPDVTLLGVVPPAGSGTVTPTVLTLTYPDGPRDAESLMIDPVTGDGFIVAKEISGARSSVYRIRAATLAAPPATSVALEHVAAIDVSDGGSVGPTAADISPSGTYVAIKTLTTTYIWLRSRGTSVIDVLTASPLAPCRVPGAGTNEAIAFAADSRSLVTVAEGLGRPLVTVRRVAA